MTQPREKPFIWATWLVDVASGKRACHWKYWFKARYNHDKRPTGFDFSGWKLKHTRMLTDLRKSLLAQGHRVCTEVPMSLEWKGCTIKGSADCVQELPSEIIYYDCKSGQADDTHRIQLQIYMWMDRRQNLYPGKPLRGYIIYENDRQRVEEPTGDFSEHLEYFLDLLLGSQDGALKSPGDDCRDCDIFQRDCPERDNRWL